MKTFEEMVVERFTHLNEKHKMGYDEEGVKRKCEDIIYYFADHLICGGITTLIDNAVTEEMKSHLEREHLMPSYDIADIYE